MPLHHTKEPYFTFVNLKTNITLNTYDIDIDANEEFWRIEESDYFQLQWDVIPIGFYEIINHKINMSFNCYDESFENGEEYSVEVNYHNYVSSTKGIEGGVNFSGTGKTHFRYDA